MLPVLDDSHSSMTIGMPNSAEASSATLRLESGDHLDQPTFHARYESMPGGIRAELVRGVVIVPSPVLVGHAEIHALISLWHGTYAAHTPGTSVRDKATVILGPEDEVQPDSALVILPEHGGRSHVSDAGYAVGPPEQIVEVSSSTAAYDLFEKKEACPSAGVREYIVVLTRDADVAWFRSDGSNFEQQQPADDGIFRSAVFPGLWLDPAAVLRRDASAVLETLRRGLDSPEHADFVRQLTRSDGS